jgi:hypothetical protein
VASWLILDWDQDHFHVLSAQSTRAGVKVTHAASWPHPEPFTPSTAERVGHALKGFLKSENIAAAPVVFGLGRDRVFLKELRFPEIPPHEEVALVRFQTGKELTESIDHYAVDYVHLIKDTTGGMQQVMAVAVRKDVVAMIQTLCQAAGLKLHAITPKLFGAANAVERAVYPEESPLMPKTLNAVLTVGQRWAELCFFKGRRILQAQSLSNGPMLVAEIKRNVAVFQAQHAVNFDLTGPDKLYMFGDEQGGVQSSQNGHHLPIRMLNPLAQEKEVAAEVKSPGCFAGAVGLAEIWSMSGPKPVNLASPRRMSAPTSVTKQRGMFYGAAAAVFFIVIIGMMWYVLAQKRAEIAKLVAEKFEQEDYLAKNAQERADLEAYRDWEQTSVLWLDELFDLSARFPWHENFRVNQLTASITGVKKGSKEPYVAKFNISGYAPVGKETYVKDLNAAMSHDAHLRATTKQTKIIGSKLQYDMKIDIAKQDTKKFNTKLVVVKQEVKYVDPPKTKGKKGFGPAVPDTDPDPDPPDDPDMGGMDSSSRSLPFRREELGDRLAFNKEGGRR